MDKFIISKIVQKISFEEIEQMHNIILSECNNIMNTWNNELHHNDKNAHNKYSNAKYLTDILLENFDEYRSTYANRGSVRRCLGLLISCDFTYDKDVKDQLFTFPRTQSYWNKLYEKYSH